MGHTHTLAEWVAYLSLGLVPVGAIGFVLAFADSDASWFDPRWHCSRLVESGRLDALLITIVSARVAVHDAVLDAAALIVLLTTSPKGAMA